MRLAYGIHGYGRGHATRALAVLPELTGRHEVLILAGGDAYKALRGEYQLLRIPTFKYQLGKSGQLSAFRTLLRAAPKVMDLSLRGPALEMVGEVLAEFKPDVVISDSEAWTHRAARRMGTPRISFDHFGVLVYCDWPMSRLDRLRCRIEARLYRSLLSGEPERIVIASFHAPPPRRPGVCVVGPVLRPEVRQAKPTRGEYLLVYFSNGHIHFTPRVEQALRALEMPVVVYGTGREGSKGNLDFRPPSNRRFVEDLAGCRAVFATAGNQLICEAMHFGKALLVLPEDSFEQRLNAVAIEKMDIGMRTDRRTISVEVLRDFLGNEQRFAENIPSRPAEADPGQTQAVQAIERFAAELVGAR